jgi:hypothetical protein
MKKSRQSCTSASHGSWASWTLLATRVSTPDCTVQHSLQVCAFVRCCLSYRGIRTRRRVRDVSVTCRGVRCFERVCLLYDPGDGSDAACTQEILEMHRDTIELLPRGVEPLCPGFTEAMLDAHQVRNKPKPTKTAHALEATYAFTFISPYRLISPHSASGLRPQLSLHESD